MSKKIRDNAQLPILFETQGPLTENAGEPLTTHGLFYVTNASNMRSILASGLIRPRQGWLKYAADFQDQTPGYIPLFYGGVPHSQVSDQVTKHDHHDLPVVIEFDASSWMGPDISCVRTDGARETMEFPKVPLGTQVLLLRGVIPLGDVRRVHFGSAAAAKRFSSDCQALSNTRASLLAMNDDFSVVPDISVAPEVLPSRGVPVDQADEGTLESMRRIDAVGGVLAALTRLQHAGGASVIHRVFPEWRKVQSEEISPTAPLSEELVLTLIRWIRAEKCQGDETMCVVLCCTLDFLATPQAATGVATESLLGTLEQHVQGIREKDRKPLLERLQTIRNCVIHDESPAPFLQKKGSPVLRGLLLFLLDSEYREDRALPRGCAAESQDLLMAEIMRGALNGWSRVPVIMRGPTQAEFAVGYAMARLVNRFPGSSISRSWVDDGATLAAILQEVIGIVSHATSSKTLREMVIDERAQELDVRIKSKRIKGVSQPVLERDMKKKGKKTTLTFTLSLPWE